jgi:hypothetical protein
VSQKKEETAKTELLYHTKSLFLFEKKKRIIVPYNQKLRELAAAVRRPSNADREPASE